MEASRVFFWNIGHVRIAVYILSLVPLAFIAYGLYRRYCLWRQGIADNRLRHLPARVLSFLQNGLFQKRVFREVYPGLMHGFIFFGFVILLIGTTLIALQEDLTLPLFHWEYLKGTFYLIYSLTLDIFGVLAIAGVLMALYRRLILKPDRLDQRKDDRLVLYLLLFILITGFIVEGLRLFAHEIPRHPQWSLWSPAGRFIASFLKKLSLNQEIALQLHQLFWWLHLAAAFTFLALIPYTKLLHILTGLSDTFFKPAPPVGKLIPIDIENSETFGVEKYSEFSWKHLFDLDACIRCGRCQDVCPAYLSGKPLSPKTFIQDLRASLETGLKEENPSPIITSVIQGETLWACTTCRACEEACPLLIEHVPKHIELRRHQVLALAKFPSEIRNTFKSLERQGNPWGIPKSHRDEWAQDLGDVPLFSADIADEGYLLWVGCACSFDENNIKSVTALIHLLKLAGISFGILGRQETCCGDAARRIGNEYLFQLEAEQNISTFNDLGVKRIITLCPHGYHVFRNEYPDFGGNYDVTHHTEIMASILPKLPLKKSAIGAVTYHDPCYLGRYNDIYDAPRQVITKSGGKLVEMPHAREKSLCCGGGGGHIWMEEQAGQRISHLRITDAMATQSSVVLTACPHCLTMLTDGTKEKDVAEEIKVLDIARWLESNLEENA